MKASRSFRVVLAAIGALVSASSFAVTVLPYSGWETITLDDDYVSIGNPDKSRRPSAIDQATAGDIEIPAELQSRRVVSIGEQAFYECKNITSVVIPFGVTNVANQAFFNCTSLTNVVIPSSVRTIGELAFYGCGKLQRIAYADGAAISIGKAAFMNCSSLSSIDISATESIQLAVGAFSGCTGAGSCLARAKNVTIEERAFSSYDYDISHSGTVCTSLTNVVVDAQLAASVGELAFYGCGKLQRIAYADGAALSISIGKAAFMNCSSLSSIDMSAAESIQLAAGAFSGCTGAGSCLARAKSVTIEKRAFSSYDYDVSHYGTVCTSLTNVVVDAQLAASVGEYAFSGCGNLADVTLPDVLAAISANTFLQCSSLRAFACPTNLRQIAYRAFDTCSALESVEFNDRLQTIDDQAFYGCSSLSALEIPQSVAKIGSRAFEECAALSNIEFKEGDTNLTSSASVEIGDRAFYRCTVVTNITLSQRTRSFGSRAFAQCDALASVALPTNLAAISDSAFEGCSSLASIDLPSSLTSIGIDAFRECTSYTGFAIPTNHAVDVGSKAFFNTKYWNDWADESMVVNNGYILGFKGNPVSVVLPDSCKSIPSGMFENMTNLTTVTIPSSVVSVGSRAFANSGVSSISIASASKIGISAFEGCTRLQNVQLSPALASIPDGAFMNCTSLSAVDIPSGVTSIGDYAFYRCSSLQTVSGGDSVVSIGDYAFADCIALEAKRFASEVNYGVHVFQGCTWEEYVPFPSVGTLQTEYPGSYPNIRSVVFSSGQSNIVDGACSGCLALEYVDIPSSVVSIGANAFSGCASVTSVVMSAGLSNVGSNAFRGCSAIVSATVSGSVPVKTLFPAIYGKLKDLRVAKGCEALCDDLFNGCAALETIDIPWTVTSIGARAFYGCTALGANGVLIPEQVDSLGDQAFAYCSSLESVRFLCAMPTSVATNIYYKANDKLITAVLQPYRDSWQSSMSDFWPVPQNTVCGRRIMWWTTDCLAKITFAYYNGTGGEQCQYYLKNAGRTIDELPDAPEESGYDTEKYGDFVGWFTKPYGGDEVEEGMEVTTSMTLYAHWSANETSDDADGNGHDFSSAHAYNGYVLDGDALAGSVQIKIAKGRYSRAAEETTATATATFQLLGEGKVVAKGVIHEDATGELVHSRSSRQFSISVDGETASGSFDGMEVVAVRDVFSSSAKADKAKSAALLKEIERCYNVVFSAVSDDEYGFSGYAGISLQTDKRGTAKISGSLPDGTKLSASAPMVCAEEMVFVPAVLPAYKGKKGGIAFVMYLSAGDAAIEDVSGWIGPGGITVGSLEAVEVSSVSSMSSGEHVFAADISGFAIDGESVDDSLSPHGTPVKVHSGKWSVAKADTVRFVRGEGYEISRDNGNPSGMKLSCAAKTGLFKGKFNVYSITESGKSKRRTATVSGIVVDGIGYGCASIKNVGAIPILVE